MGQTGFYLSATTEEFYNWFVLSTIDEGPIEKFYNVFFRPNEYVWTTPVLEKDEEVLNWSRCVVNVADYESETVVLEDALYCVLVQIRKTPPRLEVSCSWSDLISGTAWEFLTDIADAYPEAADDIDVWKTTPDGQTAHKAALISKWWEKYVMLSLKRWLQFPDRESPERQALYEEFRARVLELPLEHRVWLWEHLDRWEHIALAAEQDTISQKLKAIAHVLERYEKVKVLRLLTLPSDGQDETPTWEDFLSKQTGTIKARWSFGFEDLLKVIDDFCAHLPIKRSDRVEAEYKQGREAATWVFRLDGIEIGRLVVSPLPGGGYKLSESLTAYTRGAEARGVVDIPQEESARGKLFGNIMRDLDNHIDRADGKNPPARPWVYQTFRTEPEEGQYHTHVSSQQPKLEAIPDAESRKLVELWNRDEKLDYIIRQLGKKGVWTNKTVYNKISALRSMYGDDLVKRRRSQKQLFPE